MVEEPRSHKENSEHVDGDDDDSKEEKKDDKIGIDGYCITPTNNSSKNPHKKRHISNKSSHLSSALRRMCKHQGYMIKKMERKCVTTEEFWKIHQKVDQVLHEIVPQFVERYTNELIESNLKPMVANTIIQDRDAF
ncbi:hypothetical protein Tco_1349453 [Tanacetum coccineum]